MTFRPSLGARAAALGALFAGTVATVQAHAQTLTFRAGSPIRQDQENVSIGGNHINRADCDKNDYFTFSFQSADIVGTNNKIHAWKALNTSTDCSQPANQAAEQSVCRQVAAPEVWGDQLYVDVFVRDVVSPNWGPWTTPAGADVCAGSEDEVTGVLQFFIVNQANTAGPVLSYDIGYDLFGPDAPTSVKAGVGENALVVTWEEAADARDVTGYRVYVDAEGTIDVPDGGTATGGAGAGGAGAGGAGTGGAGTGGAGTGGAGTGGAGTGGAGTGGAAGSGTASSCSSDILVPGMPVPAGMDWQGSSNGSVLEAEAENLTNGVRYAVAVASVDAYLNTGEFSTLACGIPEPVTGFFEAYREAGGGGGGGYCAIGQVGSRLSAAGIVLAALGLTLRRLRRRTSSATDVRGPS